MLAYVFWHWKLPGADAADYERRLAAFHAALASAPPPGFVRSWCAALQGADWANAGGAAYEDWYQIGSTADLDALNEGAVSASRRVPHDAAARAAGGGTAGLYRLRSGAATESPRVATWFAKPAGMSYPNLFERLEPIVHASGASLWMRQMTLGPALEFCIRAYEPPRMPPEFTTRPIALRAVFPNGA